MCAMLVEQIVTFTTKVNMPLVGCQTVVLLQKHRLAKINIKYSEKLPEMDHLLMHHYKTNDNVC